MHQAKDQKLVLVMTGLPARGKSYISCKLNRFLNWMGFKSQVFNVGNYRRSKLGGGHDYSFFDSSNEQSTNLRNELALCVLEDLLQYLKLGGLVGIHDATNTTKERRLKIKERCDKEKVEVLFIESICNDPIVLEKNISLKVNSPDYINMDPVAARADFLTRLRNYEKVYEPLEEDDIQYIKVIDVGKRVITNGIRGYLAGQIVFYLMNMHVYPRTIYLTRHGESEDNVQGKIGGDSPLSPHGEKYALALTEFIRNQSIPNLNIWTSTLQRTCQTARHLSIPYQPIQVRMLNEVYAGACEGMTYDEIKQKMPDDFEKRDHDKLNYRYPKGGESYRDVIERLKPMIIELERNTDSVLVVAHQAVLRIIYGYFIDAPLERLPYLDVPLHTVICLTPEAFKCIETRHKLQVDISPSSINWI